MGALRRPRRVPVIVAITTVIAANLTACSPATVALIGVGVDAAGHPGLYVQVCDDHIDSLSVEAAEVDGDRLGEWGPTGRSPMPRSSTWANPVAAGRW